MTISFQQLHPVFQILVGIVFLYLLLCLVALFFSRPMLFPAPASSYDDAYPTVTLKTADGLEVAGYYIENPLASLTLLFSHGNGEDIGRMQEYLEELRDLGFSVFAYDYPGYGLSQGTPTENGCYHAADAAYDYLVNERGVDPNAIVLYGRSLGGGPSMELASRHPVAGIILESAFVSAFRVLTRVTFFPFDQFRNLEKMSMIDCPSLIIHGERDEVIPFWHGRVLHEAAPNPKTFLPLPRASHNDVRSVGGQAYLDAIKAFGSSLPASKKEKP
ncbi:MAG: alpha/beta hydrolase [Opitutales bacterium]